MGRFRVLVLLVLGGLLVPLLAALGVAPAGATAVAPCSASPSDPATVVYTWVGGSAAWDTPGSWQRDGQPSNAVPNYFGTPEHDGSRTALICIPADDDVITLDSEVNVHALAIDVGAGNTLDLVGNATMFVYGAPASYESRVRADATVNLTGSRLGGPGRFRVFGTLNLSGTGTSASSLDSDYCWHLAPLDDEVAACDPPPSGGRLVVHSGGQLNVTGGGINLETGYTVQVASGGTMTLSAAGYLAVDWGAAVQVDDRGELVFANAGSIFEGNLRNDSDITKTHPVPSNAAAPLLTNNGTISKATPGVSSVSISYAGAGTSSVTDGQLQVKGGALGSAAVDPGLVYGTGRCAAGPSCTVETTSTDQQAASLLLPEGSAGVVVRELSTNLEPTDLIAPVRIDGELPAVELAAPYEVTLDYDSAIAAGIAGNSNEIRIFRGPEVYVPPCSEKPLSSTVTACFLPRTLVGTRTHRYVVRTTTPRGTWRLRNQDPFFVRGTVPLVGVPTGCAVTTAGYPATATKKIIVPLGTTWRVRWYATARSTTSTVLASGSTTPNVGRIIGFPVRRSGWVELHAGTRHSARYRVFATGRVDLLRLTRTVPRGLRVILRGDADPSAVRTYRLWVAKPGQTRLYPTAVVGRTSSTGGFSVSYRIPARAARGYWRFALRINGTSTLQQAMSRTVWRVRVVLPPPRPVQPAPVAPVSTDYDYVVPPPPPLPPILFRPTARSVSCAFLIR